MGKSGWGWRGTVAFGLVAATAVAGLARGASRHDERGGGDQEIVVHLFRTNLDTIAAAQVAASRATTDAVKDFAASIVDDRQAANDQLLRLAAEQGMNVADVRLAAGATPQGTLSTAPLINTPADHFDFDFATRMVADHQADVAQAQTAQSLARAPALVAAIRDWVPTLLQQQARAMSLAATLRQPPPRALQQPGEPPGVSRTVTGADLPPNDVNLLR